MSFFIKFESLSKFLFGFIFDNSSRRLFKVNFLRASLSATSNEYKLKVFKALFLFLNPSIFIIASNNSSGEFSFLSVLMIFEKFNADFLKELGIFTLSVSSKFE